MKKRTKHASIIGLNAALITLSCILFACGEKHYHCGVWTDCSYQYVDYAVELDASGEEAAESKCHDTYGTCCSCNEHARSDPFP